MSGMAHPLKKYMKKDGRADDGSEMSSDEALCISNILKNSMVVVIASSSTSLHRIIVLEKKNLPRRCLHIKVPRTHLHSVFSLNGLTLFTASRDAHIQLWDVAKASG
jgi:hypothetical protein